MSLSTLSNALPFPPRIPPVARAGTSTPSDRLQTQRASQFVRNERQLTVNARKRPSRGLDSVLSSPFARRSLVAATVCLVDVSDLRHEGVIGVGVGEHGADGEEDWSIVRWA